MSARNKHLKEIAQVFTRLGFTAFGGPAVHIAMMEREIVHKRKWMTPPHFLDLIGATNLIPGPNSTEMTMHIGYERAGWKGLVVAGLCFILPAVLITAVLAWSYQQYGQLPQVQPFIYGIKPAVIAVIVALMLNLGKKAVKNIRLAIIGVLSALFAMAGVNEIYILFGAGLLGIFLYLFAGQQNRTFSVAPVLFQVSVLAADIDYWKIFLTFLKIGAILYGSGYVLFAFLDAELVSKGLLSRQVLTDAIAAGQFTPGPVFSSATFIGWQLGGIKGALAATAGIFLPSFLFVVLLNPLISKLRDSKVMSTFLDTVNVASVAIILAVCVEMSKESVQDWRTITIAILGFLVTFLLPKVNTAFTILGGAALGWLLLQL